MINLKNSFILASTKFKTRKIRLIVSVIISSLMFAVIIFAIMIFQGALVDSLHNFKSQGLTQRNVLQVSPSHLLNNNYQELYEINSKSTIYQEINTIWQEETNRAFKIATDLKLDFKKDEIKNNLSPFEKTDGNTVVIANYDNLIIKKWLASKKNTIDVSAILDQKLKDPSIIKSSGYQLSTSANSFLFRESYNYTTTNDKNSSKQQFMIRDDAKPKEIEPLNTFKVMPNQVIDVFMLPNKKWQSSSNRIPVILPANIIESFLKLDKLKNKSSKEEVIKRNQEIIDKANGFTFKQCFYNQPAINLLNQAEQYKMALEYDNQHRTEADFVSRVQGIQERYQMPDTKACQLPKLLQDIRSQSEKDLVNKQTAYQEKLSGVSQKPLAREFEFEIVGVSPPVNHGNAGLTGSIINLILSYPDLNATIPKQQFEQLKNKNDFLDVFEEAKSVHQQSLVKINNKTFSAFNFVEFKNTKDAKNFYENNDCLAFVHKQNQQADYKEISKMCQKDRPFRITSYGNKMMEIENMTEFFWKAIKVVGLIVSIIAIIIMSGTVGRMMADNRRETAVFRAIGFKRIDIANIYYLYTFFICLMIIASSLLIAFIPAILLEAKVGPGLTSSALYYFNAKDLSLKATLIGFNKEMLLAVAGMIIVVGFISVSLPLALSIRRNPIKDMREE